MQTLPGSHQRHQTASTLIMVMFTIAMLAVFIGLALDYTSNTGSMSRRARDYTAAQALANGSLDAAYKRWQEYMAASQASTIGSYTTTAQFATITTPLITNINTAASSSGYTLGSLSIVSVDRADVAHGQQATTYASTGPMANVPGWVATNYTYRATASVYKTADPSLTLSVSRFFQQSDASLFQAMLFFQNDLELHPGPAMTLYGLVHTNANMYLAAGSGGSLSFSSNVSFHGSQTTLNPAPNYKYEDPNGYVEGVTATLYAQESGNWGSYNAPSYATSRTAQLSNVQALYPLGTDDTTAIDPTNPNASGTHEIIERPDPISATNPSANTAVSDPDAFKAHRIWNSAGLRILINRNDPTQKVRVYTPGSADGEASTEVVPSSTAPNIANQVIGAVTVDTGTGDIYDFREGRTINADTVDMSVLTPVLNNYASYNGVVYISDITNADAYGNTGNSDAVRLTKGGVLPGSTNGVPNASHVEGMTLASDGAVYVQGDFNTGTTYGPNGANGAVTLVNQPVSNTGPTPRSTRSAVTRRSPRPSWATP